MEWNAGDVVVSRDWPHYPHRILAIGDWDTTTDSFSVELEPIYPDKMIAKLKKKLSNEIPYPGQSLKPHMPPFHRYVVSSCSLRKASPIELLALSGDYTVD